MAKGFSFKNAPLSPSDSYAESKTLRSTPGLGTQVLKSHHQSRKYGGPTGAPRISTGELPHLCSPAGESTSDNVNRTPEPKLQEILALDGSRGLKKTTQELKITDCQTISEIAESPIITAKHTLLCIHFLLFIRRVEGWLTN